MAEELKYEDIPQVIVFNGPLESGLRSLVLLATSFPQSLDLIRLTYFDHLVLHTADFGGPPSLHPDLPQSTGELLVRRRLVESGLTLMRRLHLVEPVIVPEGIHFQSTDSAGAFLDSMTSDYLKKMKICSTWLFEEFGLATDNELSSIISEKLGRWAVEFQGDIKWSKDRNER
ncbi:MAG: hypothetical protein JWQ49_3329 [Edaphobacter sp.]|nr:hypothetical protein [Edaphobacter sp.]